MERDPLTGEPFIRVVKKRARAPIGQMPSARTREALTSMAAYRTRAPKGVFRYRSHEEANAERDRWTVEAVVAAER